MSGACRTRGLACENKKHTSFIHLGYAGVTRHSLRNGFNGFLRALPGDRALLPPSSAQCESIIANLASASGCRDHTTSPSAPHRSPSMPPRPPHPAPNVRDDGDTPLFGVRDGANDASDLGTCTTVHSCDRMARRANHPAVAKPCQVTSNCFVEVAPANAGPIQRGLSCGQKSATAFLFSLIRWWLWVPVFAGTTEERYAMVRDARRSIRGTRPLLACGRNRGRQPRAAPRRQADVCNRAKACRRGRIGER
jgi:hypothetical protein